jgi:hypothetical protein
MLLNRADLIPRFNNFIRQISKTSSLLKQIPNENQQTQTSAKSEENNAEKTETKEIRVKKTAGPKNIKNDSQKNKNSSLFTRKNNPSIEKANMDSLTSAFNLIKKENEKNYSMKNLFDEPSTANASVFKKKTISNAKDKNPSEGASSKDKKNSIERVKEKISYPKRSVINANERTLNDLKVLVFNNYY